MNRRQFIKFGTCLAAISVVGGVLPRALTGVAQAATHGHVDLTMVEVEAEMVDGVLVPMWAFKNHHLGGPRIPGPIIFAEQGQMVHLRVKNEIAAGGNHGFHIPGVTLFTEDGVGHASGVTIPREDHHVHLSFMAPAAGTYWYLDHLNHPVNRVMGLHGVLIVLPKLVDHEYARTSPRFYAPYSGLPTTSNAYKLFRDLGNTDHFPGHPWTPNRNIVWVFNTIDPEKNLAASGSVALPNAAFLDGYLPRYFTINGKGGFYAAQHSHGDEGGHGHSHRDPNDIQANISISGNIGQPTIIRSLNAGLAWHSPHIHGNHVYELTENGTLKSNLVLLDTWTLPPMARKDMLHPYVIPPDIPYDRDVVDINNAPVSPTRKAWPPFHEKFPLLYPMHDHNEISNTAAGGNYPFGAVTHWQIDGDLDPRNFAIFVTSADYRLRTGKLTLRGRTSLTPAQAYPEASHPDVILDIHPGHDHETVIGRFPVRPDGTFEATVRALPVVAHRNVTIMHHDTHHMHMGDILAQVTVPVRFI
jgi:hypothetical protein